MRPCILVTGASGYIGSRLVARAADAAMGVVAAVRHPERYSTSSAVEVRRFDLREPFGRELLDGVDAVVHLAAIIREDSQPVGVTEDLNVTGTRRLLEAARGCDLNRFVFVSSESAAVDSPTKYGRSKWQIERLLTGEGEVVVRPGMVTGGPPRGVYGSLLDLCRRLMFLPVVNASAPLYPVHVDDLCDAILSLVRSRQRLYGVVRVAPREPIYFSTYLRMLARERLGRSIILIPLPANWVLWANRIAAAIPGLPSVSEERLMGLAALGRLREEQIAPREVVPPLRSVSEVLADEGRRRRLLLEGRTLFRYAVGRKVSPAATRRYARAVLLERDHRPLDLMTLVHAWPWSLRLIEPLGASGDSRLRRRLLIAMRIMEMTTTAAPIFHNYHPAPKVWTAVRLVWLLIGEACLLPVRALGSWLSDERPD